MTGTGVMHVGLGDNTIVNYDIQGLFQGGRGGAFAPSWD